MKISVLFNSEAADSNLRTGWGVSFLVGETVMFDTGEDGGKLLHNMRLLKVAIDKLEVVVLSHDHGDHTGGLWELLKVWPEMTVCICPHFNASFKAKAASFGAEIKEFNGVSEIRHGIYSSGEMNGLYKGMNMYEQALLIKTGQGLSVLTGCAHPGIMRMLKNISDAFPNEPFYTVAGGFHLKDKGIEELQIYTNTFEKHGVQKVGPTHCSGHEAETAFKRIYKNSFLNMAVGSVFDV